MCNTCQECKENKVAVSRGCTPIVALENIDESTTVMKVVEWTGCIGFKPELGYIGVNGIVRNPEQAINVKGGNIDPALTDDFFDDGNSSVNIQAEVSSGYVIRKQLPDGRYNLSNLIDSKTGERVEFNSVSNTSGIIPDGVIYRKLGDEYFVDTEYIETQSISINKLGVIYDDASFDNSPIIQNFIDRLKNDIPVTIKFPENKVIYVTQIRIRSNITLQGSDLGGSTIRRIPTYSTDNYPNGQPDMGLIQAYKLDKTGPDPYWKNIKIRDLTIDGNVQNLIITIGSKVATVKSHNIDLRLVDGVVIENCNIINSLWSGVGTTGCQNVIVKNCYVDKCGIKTWDSEGISRNGLSFNAVWWNPVAGQFVFEDSRNYQVINNVITDAHQEGIQFVSIRNLLIDNNTITGCLDRAIEGDNAFQGGEEGTITITNNYCVDNRWGGMTFRSRPANQYVVIIGNTIRNASRYAIYVVSDDVNTQINKAIISDNIIENIGYENPGDTGQNVIYMQADRAIISGNIMTSLYQRAISFQQARDVIIDDNIIEAAQAGLGVSAVGFSAGAANDGLPIKSIDIHNNRIKEYSTAGIVINSSVNTETVKISNNSLERCYRYIQLVSTINNIIIDGNVFVDNPDSPQNTQPIQTVGAITNMVLVNNICSRTNRLLTDYTTVQNLQASGNSDSRDRKTGLTTAPTVAGVAGDIIWNSNPSKNSPVGWIYVQGNSTTNIQGWLAFGNLRANERIYGQTPSRPTLSATDVGYQYFDTILNRPIYWNGTQWIEDSPVTIINLTDSNTGQERTIQENSYNGKKETLVNTQSISSPCIVYLSLASNSGRTVTVVKTDNSSYYTRVSVRTGLTERINGQEYIDLNNQWESITLISTGTDWRIVSRYNNTLP